MRGNWMWGRPDTRDREWERVGNRGKEIYKRAWLLREAAKAEKDPEDYFNPYDCLQKRKLAVHRALSEPKRRLVSKSRSFDRLYSPTSPLLKGLQPVHSFRRSLKALLAPPLQPRSSSTLKPSKTPAGMITTEDIGNYKEDLVPLLKRLAPRTFSSKKKPIPREEIQPERNSSLKPLLKPSSRSPVRQLKWVDRSLQPPSNPQEKRPNVMKEWEISLSTYLTRLKRKQESRKKPL